MQLHATTPFFVTHAPHYLLYQKKNTAECSRVRFWRSCVVAEKIYENIKQKKQWNDNCTEKGTDSLFLQLTSFQMESDEIGSDEPIRHNNYNYNFKE